MIPHVIVLANFIQNILWKDTVFKVEFFFFHFKIDTFENIFYYEFWQNRQFWNSHWNKGNKNTNVGNLVTFEFIIFLVDE